MTRYSYIYDIFERSFPKKMPRPRQYEIDTNLYLSPDSNSLKKICAWEVKVVATTRSIHSPRRMDTLTCVRRFISSVTLCRAGVCRTVGLSFLEWKMSPQHPMRPSYCQCWSWQVPRRYFHTEYNRQITCSWALFVRHSVVLLAVRVNHKTGHWTASFVVFRLGKKNDLPSSCAHKFLSFRWLISNILFFFALHLTSSKI